MLRTFTRNYSLKRIVYGHAPPIYKVLLSNANIVGIPFEINITLFQTKVLSDIELRELSRNVSFLTERPIVFRKLYDIDKSITKNKNSIFEIIQSRELKKVTDVINKYGTGSRILSYN